MNEMLPFKMGVKFSALLYMGENCLDIFYKVMSISVDTVLQPI